MPLILGVKCQRVRNPNSAYIAFRDSEHHSFEDFHIQTVLHGDLRGRGDFLAVGVCSPRNEATPGPLTEGRASLAAARVAVRRYEEMFRSPGLPPFAISAPLYDLHGGGEADWPNKWPQSDSPGVYLILGADEQVLYVGKASLGAAMGTRLSHHLPAAADGTCQPAGNWRGHQPRFVVTIATTTPFEAPSLEEYLIEELQPRCNTLGIRRG